MKIILFISIKISETLTLLTRTFYYINWGGLLFFFKKLTTLKIISQELHKNPEKMVLQIFVVLSIF